MADGSHLRGPAARLQVAPIVLAGLVSGCLGLLGGGDGVPNPTDAGSDVRSRTHDAAGDRAGREGGGPREGGDAPRPGRAAVRVSSGFNLPYWCAVTENGDVECWGDNEVGELGDGTTTYSRTPVKVKGLPPATRVAAGLTNTCALTVGGGVFCWGLGLAGDLGNGTAGGFQKTPVPVTGLESGVVSISISTSACAVKGDGSVWCWGYAGMDLLGAGQTKNALVPVRVPGIPSGATAVSVGYSTACAVRNGGVVCWGGTGNDGELGNGTLGASSTPVPVTGLSSGVVDVSVGGAFVCALTAAGAVLCWGDGTNGQLGNNDQAISPAPVTVTGLTSGVEAISSGSSDACALERAGTVVCWGFGGDGELGHGRLSFSTSTPNAVSAVPVPVKGLSGPAIAISTGAAPCAVTMAGSVECWGLTAELALAPVSVTQLAAGAGVTSVTVGGYFTSTAFACANVAGEVGCWGGNGYGQLGNSTTLDSAVPVNNSAIFNRATALAAGISGDFACGIDSGVALCWGDNGSGQLGNGTTTSSSTPVAVEGLTGPTGVAAGGNFACAITTGGGVSCWGDDTQGQLGNGSGSGSLVPVPVPGLTNVTALSAAAYYACALLMDGTVDCWGDDSSGQLGNGSTGIGVLPGPVSGLAGVTAIATGWYSACAVAPGGIVCWGDNGFGELGTGTTTSSLVPVPVNGPSAGATRVAVGQASACAIIGGGVQCWGSSGALGIGTDTSSFTPTQVVGLTSGATDIAVGLASACAVVGGGVECWGFNTAGQVGNGGAVDDFQATPVPGFP